MYKSTSNNLQTSLFGDLETMLDPCHPLYKLANMIDWACFERAFSPLFCQDNGRPSKPIRLMVGLLMLKHLRNVSDEQVVAQFPENAYHQYFCGLVSFSTQAPCASSELVHFRHRIGERGVELILKESVRINVAIEEEKREGMGNGRKGGRGRKSDNAQTAFIDSTVQEKNVTFPTDSKLLNKIIGYCRKISGQENVKVRQSYVREIKRLKRTQRFRGKAHSGKKVAAADRRMRTIAGRLVRELLRELPAGSKYRGLPGLCLKFINGGRLDGHKIYSLHEPNVLCICKSKEHKKYEFGNKVSIVRLWNGIIVGALAFRNEYDGHTIDKAMEQVSRIYGGKIRTLACDRGYKGRQACGDTGIAIPGTPKTSDTAYRKAKKHRLFSKRAGIEPVIGHCKSDHRLGRNFYKGLFGDSINVMLSAAAFNLKRAMRLLLHLIQNIICLFFGKTEKGMSYNFTSALLLMTIKQTF